MHPIYVTPADRYSLDQLVAAELLINPVSKMIRQALLLREKLSRAVMADTDDRPPWFVALYCAVRVRDLSDGALHAFQLVLPEDADGQGCNVSILQSVGLAVLGYQKGDTVSVDTAEDCARWQIEDIALAPLQRCTGCTYYDQSFGCGHVLRQFNPEKCSKSGRPRAKLL